MIDLDDDRLEIARRFGATATVNSTDGTAVEQIMAMTGNRGVDTAIEAVGVPATFEMCERILAPGGVIANVGAPGNPAFRDAFFGPVASFYRVRNEDA